PWPVNTTMTVVPAPLQIVDGNGQTGVAGLLLPRQLQVQVTDANGQPVQDAHVSFSVAPTSAVKAEIEDEIGFGRLTGYQGITSVRVRPAPGAAGQLLIEARLAGTTVAPVTFTETVQKPQIVPDASNPTTPLRYGSVYSFGFELSGSFG